MMRLALCTVFGLLISVASARDFGQWDAAEPQIREWYQALMQPDNPAVSCCGEADAYWADSFEVEGDKYVAIITDSRPDEPLRRKHVEVKGAKLENGLLHIDLERVVPEAKKPRRIAINGPEFKTIEGSKAA